MSNRFDRLLSSVNTEDLNVGSVKISAKKNKKKKNKSSLNETDFRSDDNSNESEKQNLIIAQNDSQDMSSDSVEQTIDTIDYNRKSDILFETNNNNNNLNNYFDKSDDKLVKMNENIGDDQKTQNIKVYKNPIRENNNLLFTEFIDEKSSVSHNKDPKRNQLYDVPTPDHFEQNIETTKTCDFAVKAQKQYQTESQKDIANGVLSNRQKSKDKSNVKPRLEQQVIEETTALNVSQKSSAIKWLLIITLFVAFLVIYSSIIIKFSGFCKCS